MNNLIAQSSTKLTKPLNGIGPFGQGGLQGVLNFSKIISTAIGLMTIIAVIWFLFVLLTGALGIMSSGGEKGAYENAQKKIRTGLTGLIVVISAIFVVSFIGFILGIENILNPAVLFLLISP
jgi:hypothetical protein